MDDPLIWVRAIHFAASISVAGVVFFSVFVSEPAIRKADDQGGVGAIGRFRLAWVGWFSLFLVVISGAAWLVLQAEQIGEMALAGVFSEGVVWMVLAHTDFGHDWMARLILAVLLAVMLGRLRPARQNRRHVTDAAALMLAAGLVGTLAWAGHAAATPGIEGAVHLAADFLHLVAAAAWVGALVPLALLLGAAYRRADAPSLEVAREAVLRFSTLGIASVGTLVATGIVNSWILVGSVPALIGTDYGRLLLVKVVLFLVMLGLAAVNRLWLTPYLVQKPSIAAARTVSRRIQYNTGIEAIVGAIIVVIVGLLGTLSPMT